MSENQRHRMLEKALFILEYVAKYPEGVSFTQICTAMSIPKSSAHNLLFTFENMGYLQKNPEKGVYKIGLKAFETGSTFLENNGIYNYSRELLKSLVDEVGETAHLATLDGTDVLYINKFDCSHAVRMISNIGKRVPAHATAIGKAVLAARNDEEIKKIYPDENLLKMTKNTIVSRTKLLKELNEIRKNGFATEQEESTPGIRCIAILVDDYRMYPELSISIAVPLSRAKSGMKRFEIPLIRAKEKLQLFLKEMKYEGGRLD